MYEWLLDYQKLIEEIEFLEFNLERSKRELKRWVSGDLQGVKLQRESIAANLEENISNIEYELAHKMNDLCDAKKLIRKFRGVKNQILYKKYVEGKTLEVIANELNYSYNYIKSKHAEVMRMIKFADEVLSK
ncbi:hypothetical protein ACFFF5_17865 [Lederbergia wuyishanensis]|uniref:Phage protein n=1 Tax=Lederbergia wuyishanensis TaxID=1347903 RepID=A0ABU0D4G6_9BACI|nr:hypothetical protein [Lederbergia wuyishanensis]MCJ8008106.1 hypothetical protein [Lederbergia wuyishanensis]MDQ0343308.1 hypothetical protein [Lederbergia wuyishanensis]